MRRNLRRKRRKRLAPYGRSPIPPRRRRRGPMPPCGFARRRSISSSTRRRKCCTGARGSPRRSEPCRRTGRPSSKPRSTAGRGRDKVLVEVSDDGAGFDGERLRQRAIDMGVLSPDKLPDVTEQQSYELAFLPGLAARDEATELSGRGVGLDAVKAAVEGLGGKIGLRSAPGKGSRFTLELPLSVSMANLLLVQVGGELYGLPMTRIVATTEYDLSARG